MRAWRTCPRMVFGACRSVRAATREHNPPRRFGRSAKGGQAPKRACVSRGRGIAGSVCCIRLSHPPIGVRYLSKSRLYWRISAALARDLLRLGEDPAAFVQRLAASAPGDVANTPPGAPAGAPGNVEMLL